MNIDTFVLRTDLLAASVYHRFEHAAGDHGISGPISARSVTRASLLVAGLLGEATENGELCGKKWKKNEEG